MASSSQQAHSPAPETHTGAQDESVAHDVATEILEDVWRHGGLGKDGCGVDLAV